MSRPLRPVHELPAGCAAAREAIHRTLDGESPSGDHPGALDHLAECVACRDALISLSRIQRGLAAIEAPPLPDVALAAVLTRTSRARGASRRRDWLDWRVAAAAAAILLAVLLWPDRSQQSDALDHARLERAAAEARLALGLVGRALERTEQAAFGTVLGGEVSPALLRLTGSGPGSPADSRRNES